MSEICRDAPSLREPDGIVLPPRSLDENGRCCGRKPLVYRRPCYRHFCVRCCGQYDEQGAQEPNWAWLPLNGGFAPTHPGQDYDALARKVFESNRKDGSAPQSGGRP